MEKINTYKLINELIARMESMLVNSNNSSGFRMGLDFAIFALKKVKVFF